jgi:two-component system sensor kinase FixL
MDAPTTGASRKVEISGRLTPGGYLMVVSDNGPGVPSEMAEKLFEPLVSSKPGGMGLGLTICRTIVEAHGGGIDLAPSPLGGAAFAFTLNANVHDLHLPDSASERDVNQHEYRHSPAKAAGGRA